MRLKEKQRRGSPEKEVRQFEPCLFFSNFKSSLRTALRRVHAANTAAEAAQILLRSGKAARIVWKEPSDVFASTSGLDRILYFGAAAEAS